MPDISFPDRAVFQPQNPSISGCALGWSSCTCFACAMALDITFFGARRPTGCEIRTKTGDRSGGTSIPQVAQVALNDYGVQLEQHVGSNVCRPSYAWTQLKHGRAVIIQGNTHPLLSTPHRSTAGDVNHCVLAEDGRDWRLINGVLLPTDVFIADPAADGHFSYIEHGPAWWPRVLIEQFASALRPWGQDDPRTLGGGRMYAALTPPPRIHTAYAGVRIDPDIQYVKSPVAGRSANVRSRPTSMDKAYVVDQIPDGKRFVAYQRAHGIRPVGSSSDVWFGDWTGTRWIHQSNLTGIGGD